MGLHDVLTSEYHSQTSCQVEMYSRIFLALRRKYVSEHRKDWDVYLSALAYAYSSREHRFTKSTLFEPFFSSNLYVLSLHHSVKARPLSDRIAKKDFLCRADGVLQTANANPISTQDRYKRVFGKRVREVSRIVQAEDDFCLDSLDGSSRPQPTTPDTLLSANSRQMLSAPFEC